MSDKDRRHDLEGDLATREEREVKRPRLYRVLLHNDDYTPMHFVVGVLMEVFRKGRTEATHIMLHVHIHGIGLCGEYTREVAETKVAEVTRMARENEHPLLCTMEPAD